MSPKVSANARRVALLLGLAFVVACGSHEGAATAAGTYSVPIADHECAACGMILREQPAPRAQLVHRDGHRAFFCSIADLVTYLEAPSPHGHATAIYVEVMPDDVTAEQLATAPMPLLSADDVSFVYGGMHRPVMGEPVLTFRTRAAAERAATRLHAHVTDFAGLTRALSSAE